MPSPDRRRAGTAMRSRWARRAEADARSSVISLRRPRRCRRSSAHRPCSATRHTAASAREAIGVYEELGDRAGQSRALNNLAMLAWLDGRGIEALEMFGQAQRLATDAGDAVKAAAAEYNVGDVLLRIGRLEEARELFSELIPVLRSVGLEDYAVDGEPRAGHGDGTDWSAGRGHGPAPPRPYPVGRTGRPGGGSRDRRRPRLDSARNRAGRAGSRARRRRPPSARNRWTSSSCCRGSCGCAARHSLISANERLHSRHCSGLGSLAETHSRVELGFVLAELSRVCRRLGSAAAGGGVRPRRRDSP